MQTFSSDGVSLAYVDLGNVVVADQSGTYLSVQVGF